MKVKHINQKSKKLIINNNKLKLNEDIVDTAYNASKGLVSDLGKAYYAMLLAAERYLRTFLVYPFRILFSLFTDEKLRDINKRFIDNDKSLSDDMNRTIDNIEGSSDAKMILSIVRPDIMVATPALNKINYLTNKISEKISPFKDDTEVLNNQIKFVNFYIFLYNKIVEKDDIKEIDTITSYSEKREIKSVESELQGAQKLIVQKLNTNSELVKEFFHKKIYNFSKGKKVLNDLSNFEIDFLNNIIKLNNETLSFNSLITIQKLYKINSNKSETKKIINEISNLKLKLSVAFFKSEKKVKQQPEEQETDQDNTQSQETPETEDNTQQSEPENQNSSYYRLNFNNNKIKLIKEDKEKSVDDDLINSLSYELKCHYSYLSFMNSFCAVTLNNLQLSVGVLFYEFYYELLLESIKIDNLKSLKRNQDFESIKNIKKIVEDPIIENYFNEVILKKQDYKNLLNSDIINSQIKNIKKTANEIYTKNINILNKTKEAQSEIDDKILLKSFYEETLKQIKDGKISNKNIFIDAIDNSIISIEKFRKNINIEFIVSNLEKLEKDIASDDAKIISNYRLEQFKKSIENILLLKEKLNKLNFENLINQVEEKIKLIDEQLKEKENKSKVVVKDQDQDQEQKQEEQ